MLTNKQLASLHESYQYHRLLKKRHTSNDETYGRKFIKSAKRTGKSY